MSGVIIRGANGSIELVDDRTKFLDKMIGSMKYEIFVLENCKLSEIKDKLKETEKSKEDYINAKLEELKK